MGKKHMDLLANSILCHFIWGTWASSDFGIQSVLGTNLPMDIKGLPYTRKDFLIAGSMPTTEQCASVLYWSHCICVTTFWGKSITTPVSHRKTLGPREFLLTCLRPKSSVSDRLGCEHRFVWPQNPVSQSLLIRGEMCQAYLKNHRIINQQYLLVLNKNVSHWAFMLPKILAQGHHSIV